MEACVENVKRCTEAMSEADVSLARPLTTIDEVNFILTEGIFQG